MRAVVMRHFNLQEAPIRLNTIADGVSPHARPMQSVMLICKAYAVNSWLYRRDSQPTKRCGRKFELITMQGAR
jgi:hypothetical protein